MLPVYEKFGVRFHYPENWAIVDEDLENWPRTVSVQAPGGGFWSLHVYSAPADAMQLATDALAAMQKEYDYVESTIVHETLVDADATGYDISFYCLDLLVHARLRGFSRGDEIVLLMCQAEDREWEQVELVFRAMTTSLLTDPSELTP